MPSIINTLIDNSADVYEDTNSRTRYVNYPNTVKCAEQLPIFEDCSTFNYCHPFKGDSEISLQFILGAYELADIDQMFVRILDMNGNILREADFEGATNDIDIVASLVTDEQGLRLSFIFRPSNISVDCFTIQGYFEIDGNIIDINSQKYCRANCTDLIKIESNYNGTDCLGAYYDGVYKNTYYIDTDLELTEFAFAETEFNVSGAKSYVKNSDIYEAKALTNESAAKIIANVLRGSEIKVNGEVYYNNRLFSKNNTQNEAWVIDIELFKYCESSIKNCNN